MHVQDLCDRNGRLVYSLYGVVVHSGGMQNGHYTAYTRTRTTKATPTGSKQETKLPDSEEQTMFPDSEKEQSFEPPSCKDFDYSSTQGQWHYASDSHVKTATESEVLKSQAYLLFYERLPFIHQ